MRNLSQLFQTGWLSSKARRAKAERQRRRDKSRRLISESLEQRQLLAGDTGTTPTNGLALAHNYLIAADVDQNRQVTAGDALAVINFLNLHGSGIQITEGMELPGKIDVDGNHVVTAADALSVINSLNTGEGEGELVELFLNPIQSASLVPTPATNIDQNGFLLEAAAGSTPTNRQFNVGVGEIFFLEMSYNDLRPGTADLGAFQISGDISVSETGALVPVLTELQTINLSNTFNMPGQTGDFLFNLEGRPATDAVTINREAFFQNPVARLTGALQSLGYTRDQFRVANLTASPTTENPFPSPIIQIAYIDLGLGGMDLPNPVFSGLNTNDTATVTARAPRNPDGSINGLALPSSYDTRSRTFTTEGGAGNEEFYNQRRFGTFDPAATADAFDEVGVLGRISPRGIPGEADLEEFLEPFDVFSIPVMFTRPVTNFTISLNKAEANEAVLLYPGGEGTKLTQDQVLINSTSTFTINAAGSSTVPTVSVAVNPTSVAEDGATNLVYTFSRTGETTAPLTINYTTTGTATAGTDFTGTSATVVIPAGASSAMVTVDPTADTTSEGNETVVLTISANTGVYEINSTAGLATGTIADDDSALPTVSVAVSPSSVLEDGTANLVYTFTRTGATSAPLTINYTTGGTATAGTDFTGTATSVVIPAGSATAMVTVDPTADTDNESDETVVVTITANSAAYNLGTAVATGTITNDDAVSTLPTVSVAVNPSSVVEDGTTNLVYTFSRTGATTAPLTVSYTAGGTATVGTDYTGTSTTVVIPAGSASAAVTVDPIVDTTVEGDETVVLTISPNAAVYNLGTAAATGTITDDDTVVTPPTVSVAVSPSSVTEDGATNLVYTFTRTGATTSALTVNYTTAGTATAGTDFTGTSNSVVIPAGATSATVTVNPTTDTTVEPDETVVLTISPNATVYSVSTTAGAATGTITNDDQTVLPTVSVAVSPNSVVENGTVNLVYTFSRTGATTSALTVNYTTGGTATANTDYSGTGTSVVIPAGAASATVTVDPTPDTLTENAETVLLTISPNAGVYNVGTSSATGTITDTAVNVPPVAVPDNNLVAIVGTTTRLEVLANDNTGGETETLTVISATLTSGQGTVAPTADGQAVSLTPAAGFSGNITFNYTIRDAAGGTANSSATVNVQNFNASSISGSVFFDSINNISSLVHGASPIRDGIQTPGERGLGTVPVQLSSSASQNSTGQAINRTVFTQLNGNFRFDGLPPGTYQISYGAASSVIAGREIAGTAGDDGVADGQMSVTIGAAGGATLSGMNFTLLGMADPAIDNFDILASVHVTGNGVAASLDANGNRVSGLQGGLVSLSSNGNQEFVRLSSGFEGTRFAVLALNDTNDAALLGIIGADGIERTARLSNDQFVVSDNGRAVRFFGGIEDFAFTPSVGNSTNTEFANYRAAIDQILTSMFGS